MKDYHINVFYSEEDEGYIADTPDLEHCSAFSNTPDEALKEVLKAKENRSPLLITGLQFTRLLHRDVRGSRWWLGKSAVDVCDVAQRKLYYRTKTYYGDEI